MNKIETRYIFPPIPDRSYDWEAAREWWDLGDPIGIETRYIYPPIPDRNYDWEAVREWWDLGDPIGYGPTEQAAIDDLLRIESDND